MKEDTESMHDPLDLLRIGLDRDLSSPVSSGPPPSWEPPSEEELDQDLSGLKVHQLLGRGGMAAVYRVEDETGESFALKLLPLELASSPILTSRFRGEIQILQSLTHPHLVAIHKTGESLSGLPYYLMDDMKGGDLGKLDKIESRWALDLVTQACSGLHYLHEKGLLHRDLKPSNLLLNSEQSQVKIADFGLAKTQHLDVSQMSLTRSGTQVGTIHFLAPELYAGSAAGSIQSDLYSLGVILYQILTGKLPVGNFPKISELTNAPKSADAFMMKALSSEPASRFSSAQEFSEEMQSAFEHRPLIARRTLLAGGSSLIAASYFTWRLSRPAPPPALVPAITRTRIFDAPITHPWTAPALWSELSDEQFRLNDFVAGEEAHLIHFLAEESNTDLPEFLQTDFPGKSLTLQTASSLTLAGFPGETHIADLRLDGGTISSDLGKTISPSAYPSLYQALRTRTNSTGLLSGQILVKQASTLTTGLEGENDLIITATILGDAPLYIAPPREGKGVEIQGDNPEFSGGWFVHGDLRFSSLHAAGSGGITVDGGQLIIYSECALGAVTVKNNSSVSISAPTTMESLTIDGEVIPPGIYHIENKRIYPAIDKSTAITVKGTEGSTPEIILPKQVLLNGKPRIITAKQSGRWDRPDTWDGPMPTRAKHDKTGLHLPPIDYIIPDGITVQGSADPRGLEYFGGKSLTLEKGAIFEPQGNMGHLVFPDLHMNGGTLSFGKKHSFFARELIGGRIHISAPTLLSLPDKALLLPKDFVLQGELIGDQPIRIQGDKEEFVYVNSDPSNYTGTWIVEEGSLASLRADLFTHSAIILEKEHCWLRFFHADPCLVKSLHLSKECRIETKSATVQIAELVIDGQQVPNGVYDHTSPEMKNTLLSAKHKLTVGPSSDPT